MENQHQYDIIVHGLIAKHLDAQWGGHGRLSVWNATAGAPYRIPNLFIYGEYHNVHIDPVPHDYWVFLPPDKVFETMTDALNEIGFPTRDEAEALKVAELILFEHNPYGKVFPAFDLSKLNLNEKARAALAKPSVKKEKDRFIVTLFFITDMDTSQEPYPEPAIDKCEVTIGKNKHEWKVVEQIHWKP